MTVGKNVISSFTTAWQTQSCLAIVLSKIDSALRIFHQNSLKTLAFTSPFKKIKKTQGVLNPEKPVSIHPVSYTIWCEGGDLNSYELALTRT